MRNVTILFCLLIISCTACIPLGHPTNSPKSTVLFTATREVTPAATPTDVENSQPTLYPTPTAENPTRLWIDPNLPAALVDFVRVDHSIVIVKSKSEADVMLDILQKREQKQTGTEWVYALVARFPTVEDGLSSAELARIWAGDQTRYKLVLSAETLAVFSVIWGAPAGSAISVIDENKISDSVWDHPEVLALIPFEAIQPRYKVLAVDGFNPLDRYLNVKAYPLIAKIGLSDKDGNPIALDSIRIESSNRQPEEIITLAMTGVTALVRGTARMMNERGVLFPAQDIGAILASADLTHISNEVSFNPDCSPERAASPEGVFCSATGYIQLLEKVGTDIVELTGNHNLDKGAEGYFYSLQAYQKRGWFTFGGGRNAEEAQKPLVIERGQTKLVFLGCNMAGPDSAWATRDSPGAARCDMDYLRGEVQSYSAKGYLPIVTFQAYEVDDYMPAPAQRPSDFIAMASAGAVIISGSQAHFPQGFKFVDGRYIHYGLGNLFFDQMEPAATRKAFIDWHVFYRGKYLGTQLITIKLEDAARPRIMTSEERSVFLARVFTASGWPSRP